ncbi:MAG: 2-succinyl-5-enolpyruvyl-6-hydroxy-3-cyclohexene-1-carboxylic-acid synthase [Demequinaceae bacterium]|nr:2-succinyl-5-enolpyruvyl-6-hydroxy-3-cyclohexene-1-carboxylic-acid synthase [Demequinaceae bacterium]
MIHPAAAFARELIAALSAHGVGDFVLCPGSRSGPLAHALAQAASESPPAGAPHINLHVRIDERSAAFLALGIARARALDGKPNPVVLVTTSGTAVGNLLPAVMEAHHSGIPLILMTADRPNELRGIGANQTTDQEGIFGQFVRWEAEAPAPEKNERAGRATLLAARAVHWAIGVPDRDDAAPAPGPVHLNVEFRDPLGPDAGPWPLIDQEKATLLDRTRSRLRGINLTPRGLPRIEHGIVIAGDGAGDAARRVAEAHGWPLLAEPTSGARSGGNALQGYVAMLSRHEGQELASQVRQVVVIGRPTLSRPVQRLIESAQTLFVAAHGARWREAPRHAERVLPTVPEEWFTPGKVDGAWLDSWHSACEAVAPAEEAWNGRAVARVFIESLGADDVAMLGSSGPIRMVDGVAPSWPVGQVPTLVANRGLAGIDGTTSTAMGLALALGQPVSVLIGDVTFLHDAGGLLIGTEERRPDLRLVVVNDGGGTIFNNLEHAKAPAEVVRRVFTTPHGVNLAALAAAYGATHVQASSVEDLAAILAVPAAGVEVVEALV